MVDFLVGSNLNMTSRDGGPISLENIDPNIKYPDLMLRPIITGSTPGTVKTHNFVELVGRKQVEKEFDEGYWQTSIMSLDGIFSPVSLYPTPWNGTYHMSLYTRSRCPYCKGTNIFKRFIRDQKNNSLEESVDANSPDANVEYTRTPCPWCLPDVDKAKSHYNSANPSEVFPPYVVASGTDLQIIDQKALFYSGNYINPINQYTLNPIVLTNGEYSCFQARSSGDLCAHSIGSVAYGHGPPTGECSIDSMNGIETMQRNFSEIDIEYQEGFMQGNHRFFGLRGPLTVHGWGYDLEGFPVPNSSGEYKLNNFGNIVYRDAAQTMPAYKNQVRQNDGTWTEPYKERTFYKGWAQLPSTWPVGPVDLRWDENARVWTVGSNYRPVWITIEHDLVDDNPVRGAIEDGLSDSTPLPQGYRKAVFVRDELFIFKAPRGTALYCKYNTDNGFYQPIYNRPLITTGIIASSFMADISKTYTIKAEKAMAEYEVAKLKNKNLSVPVIETYRTEYDNPLQLSTSIGDKAIFSYINGKWTLTNVS